MADWSLTFGKWFWQRLNGFTLYFRSLQTSTINHDTKSAHHILLNNGFQYKSYVNATFGFFLSYLRLLIPCIALNWRFLKRKFPPFALKSPPFWVWRQFFKIRPLTKLYYRRRFFDSSLLGLVYRSPLKATMFVKHTWSATGLFFAYRHSFWINLFSTCGIIALHDPEQVS